jgi:sarcosine oxidase subunit gamma
VTATTERSPLADLRGALAAACTEAVRLAEFPFLRQRNVRGTPPVAPNTWAAGAVWLGPDEWLAVGDGDLPDGARAVDVSDQRTAIDLAGPAARELLAGGCTLDLRALGAGTCAQTLVAQAPVIILGRADGLRLLVRSSYAAHLAHWLLDAVRPRGSAP